MKGSINARKGEKRRAAEPFEPRIIGFLCNWCSYAGADRAGLAQTPYPPNVSIVRVMCTGRIEPLFIMKAFQQGADGVIVLACHPGDCHYKEGNLRAAQRHALLARVMLQMGVERERCRFDYVSAGEGEKYAQLVTDMVESVRMLGPLKKVSAGGEI
ncbi:methyl-viologen-reducing hydrogenase subunit delta [Geoanaerobacter pelophilus]|uniref:Methyl-viologen-reducing hydrogenase subunit delta n=1 Tax=Geoanaerobacter pelophilus TaxID=60036 RepID=A0ABQ0ML08_9BACT|nr:hydrogenase iron-sulfur subunit [Geoanaerobacter pelophilus]GAW67765.1 methyl-viologen-reducing hydrogenase subunit delta [Geoanaerobacter pelophilus]